MELRAERPELTKAEEKSIIERVEAAPRGGRPQAIAAIIDELCLKYNLPPNRVFDVVAQALGRSPGSVSTSYYRYQARGVPKLGSSIAVLQGGEIAQEIATISDALTRIAKMTEQLYTDNQSMARELVTLRNQLTLNASSPS